MGLGVMVLWRTGELFVQRWRGGGLLRLGRGL